MSRCSRLSFDPFSPPLTRGAPSGATLRRGAPPRQVAHPAPSIPPRQVAHPSAVAHHHAKWRNPASSIPPRQVAQTRKPATAYNRRRPRMPIPCSSPRQVAQLDRTSASDPSRTRRLDDLRHARITAPSGANRNDPGHGSRASIPWTVAPSGAFRSSPGRGDHCGRQSHATVAPSGAFRTRRHGVRPGPIYDVP
jgi:hypothetical protein